MGLVFARCCFAVCMLCGVLSACSMRAYRAERFETLQSPAPPSPTHAQEVLIRALGLVGTRYRYGGDDPVDGFDCSGFVTFVYRDAAGLALPRSSKEIGALDAPAIAQADLAVGDVVMFAERRRVSHVGIYVGERRFVHSPKHGESVRVDGLDAPWWREHYVGAKRLLTGP